MMLARVEFTDVRQFNVGGMEADEIVALVRGKAEKPSSTINDFVRPLGAALEGFKGFFKRSDQPPVYRAHTVLDTAFDMTPETRDATARLY